MQKTKIDREKYLNIMKSSGASAALTQLHHDMNSREYQAFEGEAGYQPPLLEDLKEIREFSCELWERYLQSL